MLKQATTNSLETNEKNRKSCQRNRSYKKNQTKITELKNTITEIKT